MLRGVEKAEADGRDALDALAHESDALKARKAAAATAEDVEGSTPPPQGAIGGSRPPTPTYPPYTPHITQPPGQSGCPHSIALARRLGGPRYRSASG